MKTPVVLVLLALCLAVPGSAAQDKPYGFFLTGNALLQRCKAQPEMATDKASQAKALAYWVSCRNYIYGVYEAALVFTPFYEEGFPDDSTGFGRVCAPSSSRPDMQQLVDVVVKYLEDYPERRHGSAAQHTWIALQVAFPCSDDEDTDKP